MKIKAFIVCCVCVVACISAQAQDLLNYPLDTVNGEEVYRYEVERSIGLYRIGINFNVQQSEIIRLNPQLRERGLHYGETLFLPTGRPVVKETQPVIVQTVVTETKTDSIVVPESAAVMDTIPYPTPRVLEFALMLPFESQQTKRSNNAERMMEFYQGALLALHHLRNDSTLYRLRVYDTERSERRVNTLCDSTELDSVRAIIGLVYPIQIERMAEWCAVHQVPLFLPFSNDIELSTHPQVLQFNMTEQQQADSLCTWIQKRDAHCVAVEVRDAELTSFIRTMRKQMRAHDIPYSALALRDLMTDSASYALDSTKENIILLHSDRYQSVRMVLPHLQQLQQAGFRIRLISQYSWQKENIFLPQVYASVFTSESARETYETLWSTYFSNAHVSETPRYDFLGYDLMQAAVAWINGRKEQVGLQSLIRWQKIENGGWQNAHVTVVVKE